MTSPVSGAGSDKDLTPQRLTPPEETPEVEGSTAEAHQERPDGGIWEHPRVLLAFIAAGGVLVAAFFLARIFGF